MKVAQMVLARVARKVASSVYRKADVWVEWKVG
jgi:hypothetical protein